MMRRKVLWDGIFSVMKVVLSVWLLVCYLYLDIRVALANDQT